MFIFLKALFKHFLDSDTFQKGAALAYYVAFSFLPAAVVLISLAGLLYGQQAASGEIYDQLSTTLGPEAAKQIQGIIARQHVNHSSTLTGILGFATLVLSASGLFSQVHNAFNNIWGLKEKPRSGILKYLTKHLTAFAVLAGSFFLVLISTAANAFLIRHSNYLLSNQQEWYLYEHILSLTIFTLAFSLIFRLIGDAKVHWKVALLSGLFTSFLFLLGKTGIGLYIGKSHVSSTFGAASSLALLMLWVYYLSQIIFLGASFVKVLADKLHLPIVPNADAVQVEQRELEA